MPSGIYRHKPCKETTKIKLSKIFKGRHLGDKWKEKLSLSAKGHPAPKTAFKKGMIPWNKNKKRFDIVGEKNGRWKGGVTPIYQRIRESIEYRLWREAVFARDNWTCQDCKQVGGELEAHHIKSFAQYPELRFAIDNGKTLCKRCHKKTNNYLSGRSI